MLSSIRKRGAALADQEQDFVYALDNVRVRLPIASFLLRILACVTDYLVVFGLTGALIAIAALSNLLGAVVGRTSPWIFAGVILGYFVLEYGYFVGFETVWNGQTPGKRLLGLRVATRLGGHPGRSSILIRNALRSVDVVVGVPFMIWGALGQRLGDLLANTVVIENRAEAGQHDALVRRTPRHWSAREVAIVEDFLRRAPLMEAARTRQMAERILEGIASQDPDFLGPVRLREPVDRLREALGVEN